MQRLRRAAADWIVSAIASCSAPAMALSTRCASRATICRPTDSQIRVPANREEFAAAFHGSATAPRLATGYIEHTPEVQTWRFRVADVISAGRRRQRAHLRVPSFLETDRNSASSCACRSSTRASPSIERASAPGAWQTIFESQPVRAAVRRGRDARQESVPRRRDRRPPGAARCEHAAAVAGRPRLLGHRGRSRVRPGPAGLVRQDPAYRSAHACRLR